MPKVWECLTSPWGKNDDHLLTLAICTIGDQHHGPPTTRKKIDEVPTRCDRLLHEVGQSKGSCNDHRGKGTNFCMEQYCLQVQDTKDDHLRQWSSVRQPRVQIILLEPRYQKYILITRTSSGQWTDGSNQPNLAQDYQVPVDGGKGSIARGITMCPMGLQDDGTNTNRRNTLQPNVRHISSHPSRSKAHHPQKGIL